jgi:hypothetical protein
LEPTDKLLKIGGIEVDQTKGYTVDTLVTASGGLFSYAEDSNGDLVISTTKEVGLSLDLTVEIQSNPPVVQTHNARPWIPIYNGNEFVGTRPEVKRPRYS